MPERLTDTLTYVLSVALALGVMAFAAYKVIKLNGMEDPPANMGLNFPPPKRTVIRDEVTPPADPQTTQSLSPVPGAAVVRSRPAALREADVPLQAYELLTVVDGVAFVEISLARGTTLIPVTVGAVLPGGLRIEAIERRNGRWRLLAGKLVLEQADAALQ